MKYIHIFLWSNLRFTLNAKIHALRHSRGTWPTTTDQLIAYSIFPYSGSLHYAYWLPFPLPVNLYWLRTLPCYRFFWGHGWTNNGVFIREVHLKNVPFARDLGKARVIMCRTSVRACALGADVADSLAPSYWQCKRARVWNAYALCPSAVIKRKAGNNRSAFASPWH